MDKLFEVKELHVSTRTLSQLIALSRCCWSSCRINSMLRITDGCHINNSRQTNPGSIWFSVRQIKSFPVCRRLVILLQYRNSSCSILDVRFIYNLKFKHRLEISIYFLTEISIYFPEITFEWFSSFCSLQFECQKINQSVSFQFVY